MTSFANSTIRPDDCMVPFVPLSQFPYISGSKISRLCAPIPSPNGGIVDCCLPCPLTQWVYPDNFDQLGHISNYLNIVGLVCCVVLLLSFMFLPVQKTSRHYLTICLVLAIFLMSFRSIISASRQPDLCYDAITPNDMYSDLSCAFTGSLVLLGGFGGIMWVFIRSLSLHLQICWQIVPGRKFFLLSLLGGWGVPAISLGVALAFSGVSYRFGDACLLNHDNSIATFWGPLLVFTGAAAMLQFTTCAYCIRVYVRSLLELEQTSHNSSSLPTYVGSIRTVTARAAYRRVRKVIALQWRGIMIVLIILADVVFFSVIFIKFDAKNSSDWSANPDTIPWATCLIMSHGDKSACLDLAAPLVINQAAVMAVLYLLALNGIWCLLLLGKWSMVTGWMELIARPFHRSNEHFVSVDARHSSDPRHYEMLDSLAKAKLDGATSSFDEPASDFSPISPSNKAVDAWIDSRASANHPAKTRDPEREVSTIRKTFHQRGLQSMLEKEASVPAPIYEAPTHPAPTYTRPRTASPDLHYSSASPDRRCLPSVSPDQHYLPASLNHNLPTTAPAYRPYTSPSRYVQQFTPSSPPSHSPAAAYPMQRSISAQSTPHLNSANAPTYTHPRSSSAQSVARSELAIPHERAGSALGRNDAERELGKDRNRRTAFGRGGSRDGPRVGAGVLHSFANAGRPMPASRQPNANPALGMEWDWETGNAGRE